MSKKQKILIVAIVAGIALLGYWLYKKYATGSNDNAYTDEKQPVDKSLRNFVPIPGKDARYTTSNTGSGKSEAFYTPSSRLPKDDRFQPSDTGKNIRFI